MAARKLISATLLKREAVAARVRLLSAQEATWWLRRAPI